MPIILLCGEDSYRINERFLELISAFKKKYDLAGLNVLQLDGETAEAGEVKEALKSAGFLSSKRLVTISNLFISSRTKYFFDILNNPKDYLDSVLLLKESLSLQELEKDSIFKKLDRMALKIEEYALLRGYEINIWIKNELKKCGIVAAPGALAALARAIGGDLWLAKQEIMKLSAYAKGRVIIEEDVKELLSSSEDENIFEFLDAIGAKNAKKAAETLHREINAGGLQTVLFQLIRQFRIMLMVKDYKERDSGIDANNLAKIIGAHPFVIKKILTSLNNFTREELKSILDDLFFMDKSIKTSSKNEAAIFDLFLAKILVVAR